MCRLNSKINGCDPVIETDLTAAVEHLYRRDCLLLWLGWVDICCRGRSGHGLLGEIRLYTQSVSTPAHGPSYRLGLGIGMPFAQSTGSRNTETHGGRWSDSNRVIVQMYKYNKLMNFIGCPTRYRVTSRSPSSSPHFLPSGFRPAALASLGLSLERLPSLPFSFSDGN